MASNPLFIIPDFFAFSKRTLLQRPGIDLVVRDLACHVISLNAGCLWVTPITVTDLANSCVTPLFRRPQGSQGCLEKRNHPLSSNLVVWCAKIGPKTKKVRKTSELTKKVSKIMVFRRFFKVSWFWAQFQRTKLPNSNSVDDFASLDTPGGPGGV